MATIKYTHLNNINPNTKHQVIKLITTMLILSIQCHLTPTIIINNHLPQTINISKNNRKSSIESILKHLIYQTGLIQIISITIPHPSPIANIKPLHHILKTIVPKLP